MRIISLKIAKQCIERHPDAKKALERWYAIFSGNDFRNIAEIKSLLPHADYVEGKYVFNICGNRYRLIAEIYFRSNTARIVSLLTHSQQDKDKWKR